jgi:hypothetical protein
MTTVEKANKTPVVAYLDQVDGIWSGQLHAAAEAAGPDPADQSGCSTRWGQPAGGTATAAAPSSTLRPRPHPGRRCTGARVAHKQSVPAWLRELATRAGADDPDGLAWSLALLLDGGLADGVLTASPAGPSAAKRAARALVAAATSGGR